ncbi:CHAD domain-containing protein [Weissella paramesenteroides]|uniref:CHAD domain-containing protein n=1 Tax=Weissella paramesenteroides TaxID=1249 RepID=UPI003F7445F1
MSVKEILQQQYQQIKIEWLRYQNNPYEVERVHDLRVSIRTLRGLIKFLKPTLSTSIYNQLNTDLGEFAQYFSDLRDLDVLIAKVGEYAYQYPETGRIYPELFKQLQHRRVEKMAQILTEESRAIIEKYLDKVNITLKDLNFEGISHDKMMAKEFKRRDRKLMKQYNNLDFQNYERVHHVRKRAKTLRYSATYFADYMPEKEHKRVKRAKKIQDICGAITDAHVIKHQLQDLAEKTTSQSKYEMFMKIADYQENSVTVKDVF